MKVGSIDHFVRERDHRRTQRVRNVDLALSYETVNTVNFERLEGPFFF